MADLSIQLGCFDLSSPPFLGKQKLAPGNQNVRAGHEQAGLVTCKRAQKAGAGAGRETSASRLEQAGEAERVFAKRRKRDPALQ